MAELLRAVKHYLKHVDYILLGLALASTAYGMVLIYSATRSAGTNRYVLIQGAALAIGLVAFVLCSLIDMDHVSTLWKWVYVLNLLMVASLAIFGVGDNTGNRSWIRFLGIGIQPAEVGKLFFIFTLATHIRLLGDKLSQIRSVIQVAVHILLISAAVYLFSDDLGMVLAYLFIGAAMVFAAGIKLRWFGLAFFGLFALAPTLWSHLSTGQKNRILVVFDPSIDPTKAWHAEQSKIALGAGQLTGQGYLQGRQVQYSQLPAKHTDFIFSVAGEEFGFLGCLLILILLTLLIFRVFYVAFRADEPLPALICTGVGSMLLFQSIINIGMCVGLTPVIGLTLPFFSYGGSSLVTMYACIGIVSGIRMREKPSWLQ